MHDLYKDHDNPEHEEVIPPKEIGHARCPGRGVREQEPSAETHHEHQHGKRGPGPEKPESLRHPQQQEIWIQEGDLEADEFRKYREESAFSLGLLHALSRGDMDAMSGGGIGLQKSGEQELVDAGLDGLGIQALPGKCLLQPQQDRLDVIPAVQQPADEILPLTPAVVLEGDRILDHVGAMLSETMARDPQIPAE